MQVGTLSRGKTAVTHYVLVIWLRFSPASNLSDCPSAHGLTLGTVALIVSATVTSGVDYPQDLEDPVPPFKGTIVQICG